MELDERRILILALTLVGAAWLFQFIRDFPPLPSAELEQRISCTDKFAGRLWLKFGDGEVLNPCKLDDSRFGSQYVRRPDGRFEAVTRPAGTHDYSVRFGLWSDRHDPRGPFVSPKGPARSDGTPLYKEVKLSLPVRLTQLSGAREAVFRCQGAGYTWTYIGTATGGSGFQSPPECRTEIPVGAHQGLTVQVNGPLRRPLPEKALGEALELFALHIHKLSPAGENRAVAALPPAPATPPVPQKMACQTLTRRYRDGKLQDSSMDCREKSGEGVVEFVKDCRRSGQGSINTDEAQQSVVVVNECPAGEYASCHFYVHDFRTYYYAVEARDRVSGELRRDTSREAGHRNYCQSNHPQNRWLPPRVTSPEKDAGASNSAAPQP